MQKDKIDSEQAENNSDPNIPDGSSLGFFRDFCTRCLC